MQQVSAELGRLKDLFADESLDTVAAQRDAIRVSSSGSTSTTGPVNEVISTCGLAGSSVQPLPLLRR